MRSVDFALHLSTRRAGIVAEEYDFASAAFKSCILQWRESGLVNVRAADLGSAAVGKV